MQEVLYTNTDIYKIGTSLVGDYAYLLAQAVRSNDQDRISRANYFASGFDVLHERVSQDLTKDERNRLNQDAIALSQEFRQFVLDILAAVLTKGYEIYFKPPILNNIINIVNYYIYMLDLFLKGRYPVFDPVMQELFWLPVFSLQCRYIADNVGYYSKTEREKAHEFADICNEKYLFAVQLQGYVRIGKDDFPIAKAHHQEVDAAIKDYAQFLVDLIQKKKQNRIPGTLDLLFLDSAYRQLCVFSTELAAFIGTQKPACDPYARRYNIL